jgi:hypothetical protein
MRRSFVASVILSIASIFCDEEMSGVRSRIVVRHTEPGSFSYDKGYTTTDLLYVANGDSSEALFNLRGHVFNNQNIAVNAGLGLRFVVGDEKFLVGTNFYYDFSDSLHQFGGGLECLGSVADFRINAYVPVVDNIIVEKRSFDRFSRNFSFINRYLSGALAVVEGEMGIPFGPLYLKLGHYYLFGQEKSGVCFGKQWGAQVGADIKIGEYFSIGGTASYDKIFKRRWKVYLSTGFPFGKWLASSEGRRNLRSVPIMRRDIISVETQEKKEPLLGVRSEEVRFVFVNNAVPLDGDGSFERPFNHLREAEEHSSSGDVIYVLPGDGTSKNMDEGINLKENQMFVSSAVNLEIDGVVIPAITPGQRPTITNRPGLPIITSCDKSKNESSWYAWFLCTGDSDYSTEVDRRLLENYGGVSIPRSSTGSLADGADFGSFNSGGSKHSNDFSGSDFFSRSFSDDFNSPKNSSLIP